MRSLSIFSLIFFCSLFFSHQLNAQSGGWKWGLSSQHLAAAYNKGYDAQQAVVDQYGNVITAGYGWGDSLVFGTDTLRNPFGAEPMIVIKTDTNGHYVWERMTLHSNDDAQGMAIDTAGNIYILGSYDSTSVTVGTITLTNTSYPMRMTYLAKYSPAGTVLWAINIAQGYPNPSCLGIDAAQNLYIVGAFQVGTITIGTTTLSDLSYPFSDVYIAKFDKTGGFVWAKSFGGPKTDMPTSISVAPNGTSYIAGTFYSASMGFGTSSLSNSLYPGGDFFLVSYDANGTFKWAKETPNVQYQQMTTYAANGYTYATGFMDTSVRIGPDSLTTAGGWDAVTAAFDSTGTFKWGRSGGGHTTDQGFSIMVDNCGKVFTCGQMGTNPAWSYSMNFSGHTLLEPAGGNEPMYVAEYDTAGNYVMTEALLSGGDDFSRVLVDNRGYFYISGDLVHTMTFGPDVLPNSGIEAFFIAQYKYDSSTCYTSPGTLGVSAATTIAPGINLYPNPASFECTITSDAVFASGSRAELYDLQGRLINAYTLTGNATTISLASIPKGMYLCRVTMEDGSVAQKKLVIDK